MHTQLPWHANGCYVVAKTPDGGEVNVAYTDTFTATCLLTQEERHANAEIIAKAVTFHERLMTMLGRYSCVLGRVEEAANLLEEIKNFQLCLSAQDQEAGSQGMGAVAPEVCARCGGGLENKNSNICGSCADDLRDLRSGE